MSSIVIDVNQKAMTYRSSTYLKFEGQISYILVTVQLRQIHKMRL
jgi:hypothetical protein